MPPSLHLHEGLHLSRDVGKYTHTLLSSPPPPDSARRAAAQASVSQLPSCGKGDNASFFPHPELAPHLFPARTSTGGRARARTVAGASPALLYQEYQHGRDATPAGGGTPPSTGRAGDAAVPQLEQPPRHRPPGGRGTRRAPAPPSPAWQGQGHPHSPRPAGAPAPLIWEGDMNKLARARAHPQYRSPWKPGGSAPSGHARPRTDASDSQLLCPLAATAGSLFIALGDTCLRHGARRPVRQRACT